MCMSMCPFYTKHAHKCRYQYAPIMRKRGRPKGAEVTVIGLPSKKSKKGAAKNLPKKPRASLHFSLGGFPMESGI